MIKYVVTGILAAPSGAAVFVLQKKIVYPKIHDLFCCRLLFYDSAVALAECASCISFVSVDVHSAAEAGAYANNYTTQNCGALLGDDLNRNNFLVANAEIGCFFGSNVDVTLCSDNAFSKVNLAARTNELASGRACGVAAFTNGSVDSEGTSIGERYLNLRCLTSGTENRYVGNGLLGAYDGNSFFASVLTGLAELLLVVKGCALAAEDRDVLFAKMYVTSGSFH